MLGDSERLYGHGVTYQYWLAAEAAITSAWHDNHGLGEQVKITGFDACLPLFGLPGR